MPLPTPPIRRAVPVRPQRFWSRVDRSGGPNACWPWRGTAGPGGYGQIKAFGRQYRAHRIAYLLAHGPIAPGMSICHACDNPSCVNPRHLWQGTHRQNMLDRKRKRRGGNLKGMANGRAKLARADVLTIRRLMRAGHRGTDLAERYGVTSTTIYNIAKGKLWPHLKEERA